MTLPADFSFSQSSLQDYLDCPRRFELRYQQRLSWPAIEIEPALENERFLLRGSAFHRLVHQHQIGIPESALTPYAAEPELSAWWQAYLAAAPGRAYVIYFTDGGSVGLDLRQHPGRYTLRWIDIAAGEWAGTSAVAGGSVATIAAPKIGHWLAVLVP